MSHQVKTLLNNVTLSDGNTYGAGVTVTLTDVQYFLLDYRLFVNGAILDLGSVPYISSGREPSENYLVGWTAPPEYMNSDNPPTAGELYLQRIIVTTTTTLTKIYTFVVSAGSGMTANQNWVGLFDANGNQLTKSADVSAVWTSTHVAQIAVPATPVIAGSTIYVGALFNGSGMPQLAGGGQQYWDLPNVGAGVSNWGSPTPPYTATAPNHWRYMSYSSGLTALPNTVALGSASPDKAFWFGVA